MDNVELSKLLSENYFGRVLSYDGQVIEASPLPGIIGSLCTINSKNGEYFQGEIVGVGKDKVNILPYESNLDVRVSDKVLLTETQQEVDVGDALLGRVIDGLGNPLDGLGAIKVFHKKSLNGIRVNPFDRQPITEILDVGIRNINALLTLGRGQRVGIVAGSGVGKSVLLSMITKSTDADVVVVSLIGERGRELASFTKEILSSHSRDKVVIVAVPADRSPLLRIQGAKRATSIAEYFRDTGKNVLLITDSLTRVAHAQRELGLALGEQPTSRGYPPSGNINAQVNIEIDFTRKEISQEIVDPDTTATLSEQNSLNVTAKKDAVGIPGAIANEPPQEATVNQEQNQAGLAAQVGTDNQAEEEPFETKSSTNLKNYEVSKTYIKLITLLHYLILLINHDVCKLRSKVKI